LISIYTSAGTPTSSSGRVCKRRTAYRLALELNPTSRHCPVDRFFIRKRRKCKAFRASGFFVKHDRSIHNLSELRQKLFEAFTGNGRCETAHENFSGTFMFCTWNGSFWVDLAALVERENRARSRLTCLPSKWCARSRTRLTLAGLRYVRKAKPRDRPVGSRMTTQESISPYCAM
jgi:hypothetical protein